MVSALGKILEIIILIIAAFFSSTISAFLGMGGGIILLGIMALFIPNGFMVIAIHGMIQLISNSTRTYIFKKNIKKEIIKEFIFGVVVGSIVSIIIILILINFYKVESASEIKVDFLKPLIGFFILWYLFFKTSKQKNTKSFFKVGFISGLTSIFIGATGPLIAPFFLKKKLLKEEIIANKAACQVITHLTKIPIFIYFFNINYFKEYLILIPLFFAVFIGTNFGKKILKNIPEAQFKKIFKIVLFVIAVRLILSPL